MDQVSNLFSRLDNLSDRRFYLVIGTVTLLFAAMVFIGKLISYRNEPVFDIPIEEMLVEVESNGRQAVCSDLTGKWFVAETRLEVEFRPAYRTTELPSWVGSKYYTCDDANRMAAYNETYRCVDEWCSCTVRFSFGKIYNDVMEAQWDFCSDSGEMVTRLMVRQEE